MSHDEAALEGSVDSFAPHCPLDAGTVAAPWAMWEVIAESGHGDRVARSKALGLVGSDGVKGTGSRVQPIKFKNEEGGVPVVAQWLSRLRI